MARDLHDNEWIQTLTGRPFWPLDAAMADVHIRDIARGLACKNRFNGQTRLPISVAQHSVLVSQHVPAADALWGLLHDAAEAYLTDVPAPIKGRLFFSVKGPGQVKLVRFADMEDRLLHIIGNAFGLPWPVPVSVKAADLRARRTERRDLMGPPPRPWRDQSVEPFAEPIVPWDWHIAEGMFLDRFAALTSSEPQRHRGTEKTDGT